MKLLLDDVSPGIIGRYNNIFKAWFLVNDIFIGVPGVDFKVEYNPFHKFYNLQLFEIKGNSKNPRGHWKEVLDYLKKNDYNIIREAKDTWRWSDHYNSDKSKNECIPGITIWIKAQV